MGGIQLTHLATQPNNLVSTSARQQIVTNLVFTLIKSASLLLSIRLADALLSAQILGLILLFRRQGALWSNLAQLGLSQVLLKYYVGSDDPAYRYALWRRASAWVTASMLLCILAAVIFSEPLHRWLFPTAPPIITLFFGIYVAGLALGFVAGSSWLAEFRFTAYNLTDWLHGSLLFIICILLFSNSHLPILIGALAISTVLISAVSLRRFAQRFYPASVAMHGQWQLSTSEKHYGITRALTAYMDIATMVIGPWLLRHQPEQAAQLIIAYTVLRMSQTLILPIAQVLALRANSNQYHRHTEQQRITKLCILVFFIAWLSVACYYWIGAWLIQWWVPNIAIGVVKILDQLMPYMPALCVFYSLRNHIDLQSRFPWNLTIFSSGILLFFVFLFFQQEITLSTIISATKIMLCIKYISLFLLWKKPDKKQWI
jgi:hypothetical protein